MNLYANKSRSQPQKIAITGIELVLIALSAWIMFAGGQEIFVNFFSWPVFETTPSRRWIILSFSVIVFARYIFMMFYLMKRAIPWVEIISVPLAFSLYYVGFAILVLPSNAAIGIWDWAAVAIFLLGSWLNTASEKQRFDFKALPENKGKLYTGGLFSQSMHINFFGDILWILAYAIVTQNIWSTLIVIFITIFFAFFNIPMLDKYLAGRYGDDFKIYAGHTKRLVPFVW